MSRRRRPKSEPDVERALRDMRRRNHNIAERRKNEGWGPLAADYPTRFRLEFYDDEQIAAWVREGLHRDDLDP